MQIESQDNRLAQGVLLAERYLPLDFSGKVIARHGTERGFSVERGADGLIVHYDTPSDFFQALGCVRSGCTVLRRTPVFSRRGVMLDCARNGVPSVEGLKRFIVSLAFAGYNYLGLYLEDCLEVEGEPYMGYMRGRYTRDELREVIAFASPLGIEIVPFVQTLAHMGRLFHHWEPYFTKVRDIDDILLIDEPRTYELIENILRTVADVFPCKRVNLGMDEAFMMGFGKYREKHGVPNVPELFLRHLRKVCELCRAYRLRPYVWADMLQKYFVDGVRLPEELTPVVWEYSLQNERAYAEKIERVCGAAHSPAFAAGICTWTGYAPLFTYTDTTALPAVRACKGRTDDFLVTIWGDDGAECSYNATWYSLLRIAAEQNERPVCEEDTDKTARFLTGYSLRECKALERPNLVFDAPMNAPVNVSKYALFEDIFMGVVDCADSLDWRRYFARHKRELNKLRGVDSPYAPLYDVAAELCGVLECKSDLRPRLMQAYQSKDRAAIAQIAEKEIPRLLRRLNRFYKALGRVWSKERKPFGWEVQAVRLGGLMRRLQDCRARLSDYVHGRAADIPEWEQADLSPAVRPDDAYNGARCYNDYAMNVTYGKLP